MALGEIAAGTTKSGNIPLRLACTGSAHATAGSNLAFDAVEYTLGQGSSGSTSELTAVPTLSVPASWPADRSQCNNAADALGNASVTVTVPGDAANGTRSIQVKIDPTDPDVSSHVVTTVTYTVTGSSTGSQPPPDTTAPGAPGIDLISTSDTGVSSTDDVTRDNTPTLAGTAEAGAIVTVYRAGVEFATVPADSAGAWSFTPGEEIADGVATYTATATDAAGNTSPASTGLSIRIDTVAPSVVDVDVNDTTWRNSALSQEFTASDTGSGLKPGQGLTADDKFTLTAEAESTRDTATNAIVSTSVSKIIEDVAGNSTTRSLAAWIDLTPPTISGAPLGSPNGDGWYKSNVTVDWTCGDVLSGIASCPPDSTISSEGSGLTASGTATDVAGNSSASTASAPGVNIDKTPPSLNISGAASGAFDICANALPTRPTFAPSDSISGLDGTEIDSWSASQHASGVGTYTYTAQAQDLADNFRSETRTYTVSYGGAFSGYLQPVNADGTSRFKLGSTIPVKFRLTCGTTQITDAVAKLNISKADSTPDPGVDEAVSTAASTTGNLFRYDSTGQQYIFNLSTKSGYTNPSGSTVAWSAGSWRLSVILDDGTHRNVNIQLVK